MTFLLKVTSLNLSYPNAALPVVQNLSFDLQFKEMLACVGPSGCGKSSLAYTLAGLAAAKNLVCSGNVVWHDSVMNHPHRVAMIFQDPMASLDPLWMVGAQGLELIELYYSEMSDRQKQELWQETLRKVHLNSDDVGRKYPHQLSGGMCQRVAIALALLGRPALLIADEPTTALDPDTQAVIMELLVELTQREQMSCLLISHDRQLVRDCADRQIELGEVPKEERFSYRKSAVDLKQEPLLQVKQLSAWYPKQNVSQAVIHNLSFEVYPKEVLGIVGPSGVGKSTVKKALLDLIPWQGRIVLDGQAIHECAPRLRRKALRATQPVFQQPRMALDDLRTVKQHLEDVVALRPSDNPVSLTGCLAEVGLSSAILDRYPPQLSGGECQRVVIARALLLEPRVLIADEPTASLDADVREGVMALLQKLISERAMAMVLISHDMELVKAMAHRVLSLSGGRGMTLAKD